MSGFRMQQSICDVTIVIGLAVLVAGASSPTADDAASREGAIDVGSRTQLMIDRLFISSSQGITLKVQPARKTGEQTLTREHPWESASVNWFSVIQDAGRIDKRAKYRMWYEAYDVDGWYSGDDTAFCYAESRDGIHWTKPELGLFAYKGSTRNNILFRQIGPPGARSRVHGTGVFLDPHAKPDARYKGIGQGIFSTLGKPPHRVAGMYSADGLKWTRFPKPICNVFADSQYSAFWDPSLGKYVAFGRVGGRGRSLGRSVSDDFMEFDRLKLVMQTDDNDPADSDLYNSPAIKYPYADRVYLMFPSLYQHGPDTLDIRLAVSRDGVHWSRPDRDAPFVKLGDAGAFDTGSLYMGQGMLRVGNELWMYYSGSPLKHGEGKLENLMKPANGRIFSRVVSRLDRLVSATAGSDGGHFTTPLLTFAGDSLELNVNVLRGGSLRIGLLDGEGNPVPGRTVESCIPITGDHLSKTVRWKTGHDVSTRAGKTTGLRIELKNARLFAFRFSSAE